MSASSRAEDRRRRRAEEAAEEDRKDSERRTEQQACIHYNAVATRFHWSSGKVAEVHCLDCDATRSFDEDGTPYSD